MGTPSADQCSGSEIAGRGAMLKGNIVFLITQGPNVRVRKVEMIGNTSFSEDKLKDQIKTRHWLWVFRAGTYDAEQIEDDAASIRRQAATVAVLAGVGMQTNSFEGVPGMHMFHAVTALRRNGQEFAARMIAAEALSRT